MGTVAGVYQRRDHVFITSFDGRDIYFHRTNVTGAGFDSLSVGNEIRYTEEENERSPQGQYGLSIINPAGRSCCFTGP